MRPNPFKYGEPPAQLVLIGGDCMKYLAIVLLLLSACGKSQYHDPAFSTYVSQFEQDYSEDTSSVYLHFVDKESDFEEAIPGIVGECTNNNEIKILRPFFEASGEGRRHMLIFHELGHCILNRKHTDPTAMAHDKSQCPSSIMAPSLPNEECWIEENTSYIEELIQNKGN